MAKKIPDVRFELNAVYKMYADQLLIAGNISEFLIDNSNISSAGGQVEGSLRVLLKKLLPKRVMVSHGHIVDKSTAISNQQDVLITESFYTKSLIKTLDGTEFFCLSPIFAFPFVTHCIVQGSIWQGFTSFLPPLQRYSPACASERMRLRSGFGWPGRFERKNLCLC